jgi:8-oxo-dGTP pyrophosphatase MutT (NUDIX family)
MSSYLRHIRALNPPITEPLVPWTVAGQTVGWLRSPLVERLLAWPEVFRIDGDQIALDRRLDDFRSRTEALGELIAALSDEGILAPLIDEPYPVTPAGREAALAVLDRAAAAAFGVRAFGQHLNGYVRDGEDWQMWIGRRARDRRVFPGALDQVVAGGLPFGVGLNENLVKECQEEAGMPPHLARQAKPVGVVTYNRMTEKGFRPDVLYCYDLELSPEFRPLNTDGEVQEFLLLPLEEVMQIVRETDEFKLNCNLVLIDFLVRHGFLGPESPEYLEIVQGLRPSLGPEGTTSLRQAT